MKRAFGPEEVERAVEDAKRREAAEKEQRKAKRKFSRGRGKSEIIFAKLLTKWIPVHILIISKVFDVR